MDKTLLAKLHDIHEPLPISWWPLSWGWYGLFGGLMVVGMVVWFFNRHKPSHLQQEALFLLSQYEHAYLKDKDAAKAAMAMNTLLKRVCLAYYGRTTVARLQDVAWIEFLNEKSQRVNFTPFREHLTELPYQATHDVALHDLFSAVRTWILERKKHV